MVEMCVWFDFRQARNIVEVEIVALEKKMGHHVMPPSLSVDIEGRANRVS